MDLVEEGRHFLKENKTAVKVGRDDVALTVFSAAFDVQRAQDHRTATVDPEVSACVPRVSHLSAPPSRGPTHLPPFFCCSLTDDGAARACWSGARVKKSGL